ncbi:MAG TPA: HAMP domain-containing sensor histidine kinase, partial [Terrimesophilobacter sp.]|nr:HAMP domain-containing sensor histidine kinase [Terrimesophilobacter sp.]
MRRRLVIVFLIPLVGVLLVLGTAYAWTAARSIQQTFYTEQLGDLSYFLTSARQSLTSGSPDVFEAEAERLYELYGTHVLVVDRAGVTWASSGIELAAFEESTATQIRFALSGRRSDLPSPALPWVVSDVVIVEPVFDKGDAIGAVVLSASAEHVQWAIVRDLVILAVISVIATLLGVVIVHRLANWVLQPVHRIDRAMAAVERGEIEARIDDETGPPELRSMIQMFNRMAEEIERVLSRQQEFALNASHELRNPLSALLMRVEYLATGLDSGWDDDVEAMREEGRRLTRILDTLL